MTEFVLILAGIAVGVLLLGLILMFFRKKGAAAPVMTVGTEMVAERVRAVGKLVGLEVHAKEIATSTKGWSWIPPLLLSQAKIAMIFSFEKQYYVDLNRVRSTDVEDLGGGRFRLNLSEVEGTLRLSDVEPYDIQAGRILGLLDVIQMNAPTQSKLMEVAQTQAADLFVKNESRYLTEAKRSIGGQLQALLGLFDASVEIIWPDESEGVDARPSELVVEGALSRKLTGAASE
jgi:hypothetical protein